MKSSSQLQTHRGPPGPDGPPAHGRGLRPLRPARRGQVEGEQRQRGRLHDDVAVPARLAAARGGRHLQLLRPRGTHASPEGGADSPGGG